MGEQSQTLREHLLELLGGGAAHADFDAAVNGLPPKLRGARPAGQPHTPWRILEHMRLAQHDIVEFTINPGYESPPFPEGYWPQGDAPPNAIAWTAAVRLFRADLKQMRKLVAGPRTDLLAPLAHGSGQTVAREAMLLVDHNAYHLGQLILIRRLLGAWPE
jgi:hypothetical protein